MAFWKVALVGGLVTWTMCTYLRAVATRTQQLREQLVHELEAAREAEEPQDEEIVEAGDPAVAAVVNVPKTGMEGKPRAGAASKNGGRMNGSKTNGRSSPAHGRPGR